MSRLLVLLCLVISLPVSAAEPPARQLAQELLALAGTAAVLDDPRGRAALADPMPFLGEAGRLRRERLLDETGLRRWRPPRVWLLEARREGEAERWSSAAPRFQAGAAARGYALVDAAPLPAAEQAIALLAPGSVPAGFAALLDAYGADVLVLVRGEDWTAWLADRSLQGRLPARQAALLPQVLAEALAALQQWPEAAGQPVVEVAGVGELAAEVGVRQALAGLEALHQVRLIRVAKGRAWYTAAAPARDELAVVLDGEPRLPARAVKGIGATLPPGVEEARQLACPLLRREWTPEAAPRLPEAPATPVQSDAPAR